MFPQESVLAVDIRVSYNSGPFSDGVLYVLVRDLVINMKDFTHKYPPFSKKIYLFYHAEVAPSSTFQGDIMIWCRRYSYEDS